MTVTVGEARPRGHLRTFLAGEIRAAMARENLSGVGLAAILGKSQPYISRRLSGRLAFDVDDLEVIGDILRVSPSDLMAEAIRRISEAQGQPTTGANTVRCSTPSPPPPTRLALVRDLPGDYQPVAGDYRNQRTQRSGRVGDSANAVNHAYAA